MNMQVKFQSTILGDISNLDALVQEQLVPSPEHTVTYKSTVHDKKLRVTFRIAGTNGTPYAIKYTCIGNGVNKIDPNKPEYFTGKIKNYGYVEETLLIKLK